jgi:hypothetical protein
VLYLQTMIAAGLSVILLTCLVCLAVILGYYLGFYLRGSPALVPSSGSAATVTANGATAMPER